jgi:serine/threonine-protein kinase
LFIEREVTIMLRIGEVIDGKYRILSKVGSGGMSTVYLAINDRANKPWAIKEVRRDGVQNFDIVRQSLVVETDLLKKLKHKNLPSIVDVIDRDDHFLIVMDYIEGITLERIVNERGPQKQEDVVAWAIQLCDVLKYLHSRKPAIIYRDMKPSNIMLRYDKSVVLIDFGTAREYKVHAGNDTTCLGTQGYAAPEQFGGMGQTDARTDIYCIGATMYHLLTGHNPAKPPYEMYPITHWDESLSTGLESIILKCTQKNPDDRFQSAQELMYALKNYRDMDKQKIKKYKMTISLFASAIMLAFICLGVSAGSYAYAMSSRQHEYEYLVDVAKKAGSKEDKTRYYLNAIDTDSTRPDAYDELIDMFLEDGVFDEKEEATLVDIRVSTKKYFNNLEKTAIDEYADLCFKIGNAYWFYYTHEESRQSAAVAWFDAAASGYMTLEQKEREYRRCNIYMEIGNFYKKIIQAQIEGTDADMYGKYWNNLMELKALNDENPDREFITLRLYEEIITRSMEYGKYLKEDGITKEEIDMAYDDILSRIDAMTDNATQKVKEETDNIVILIDQARRMLNSNYRGV